jgi:uncharacterized protein
MGSPVVWFEIKALDVERAKDFYTSLFGWKFFPVERGDGEYWLISTQEGTGSGGLVEGDPGNGQAVVLYVAVEELEPTVTMATALGATVEEAPIQIGVGSYAILRDPTGIKFGLFTPAERTTYGEQ